MDFTFGHRAPHYLNHYCTCGCGQCRAPDGKCKCRGCPCATIGRCQGEAGTCMICRPVWTTGPATTAAAS